MAPITVMETPLFLLNKDRVKEGSLERTKLHEKQIFVDLINVNISFVHKRTRLKLNNPLSSSYLKS